MNNLEFMWTLDDINIIVEIIEMCFIVAFSYYTCIKIANKKDINYIKTIIMICSVPIISIVVRIIQHKIDSYLSLLILVALVTFINLINFRKNISYSMLITIISLSINYVICAIAIMFTFFPIAIIKSNNDYISLCIILMVYVILINKFLKIKKVKYGISFLKRKLEDSYWNIMMLNICTIALFLITLLKDKTIVNGRSIGLTFVILIAIIFLTMKESFDLYYKQNLLIKDIEQTKAELEEKKKEVNKLEKENIEFSKTSHSLAHRQKALEFKLEQLMKTDRDNEIIRSIKEEIKNLNEEVYKEPEKVELVKTGVDSIDNMFSYMQSECIKNNIKFELQVVGNIYYMLNNLISENDLEILIADHIKDAIIAINNSDNLNRSILVRIGKINNVYSIYFYDSGIEFTKEVLDNLGKKPITTYADTGGTGMGFMNTFDTLNKTKASLIINEIGEPCEDNYTKVLIFKFDNQNEFKVNSYKEK